jgi:hypothetical protein
MPIEIVAVAHTISSATGALSLQDVSGSPASRVRAPDSAPCLAGRTANVSFGAAGDGSDWSVSYWAGAGSRGDAALIGRVLRLGCWWGVVVLVIPLPDRETPEPAKNFFSRIRLPVWGVCGLGTMTGEQASGLWPEIGRECLVHAFAVCQSCCRRTCSLWWLDGCA